MTTQKKIDAVIKHLTESRVDGAGGSPYEHIWIGDTLVVAAEYRRTVIETYQRRALLAWHARATRFCRKHGGALSDALLETAGVPL
jgi:hypothetical protein